MSNMKGPCCHGIYFSSHRNSKCIHNLMSGCRMIPELGLRQIILCLKPWKPHLLPWKFQEWNTAILRQRFFCFSLRDFFCWTTPSIALVQQWLSWSEYSCPVGELFVTTFNLIFIAMKCLNFFYLIIIEHWFWLSENTN